MSYQFYKMMHLFGLMALFFGIGGLLVAHFAKIQLTKSARIMAFATHGIGLVALLVGGFGLLARLGIVHNGLPGWIHAKLGIWVLMAASVALIKRKGHIGWPIAVLVLGLGTTAAYIAMMKPF